MKILMAILLFVGFTKGEGNPLERMREKLMKLREFSQKIEEKSILTEGVKKEELDLEGVETILVKVYFVNLDVKENKDKKKGILDVRIRALIPSKEMEEMIKEGNFVGIEREGKTLFILIPEWQEKSKGSFIHLESYAFLEIPKDIPLTIKGKFSKVRVRKLDSPLSIENDFGNVEIENHQGTLNMETNYTEIKIKRQMGDFEGKFDFSDLEILKTEGDVSLYFNFGDLKIGDVVGNAELRIRGGAEIGNIFGNLSIETKFGWTEVGHIRGDLTLSNLMGDVFIKRVDGRREVHSKYGTVRFANLEIQP